MKNKNIESDSIFCICGEKAKGKKQPGFYLICCDKCKKEYKFDNKKFYQETIYTMFIGNSLNHIKVINICGSCGKSLYHNFKYQFCIKCRVVKSRYR